MERLTNIGSNGEIWITDNDETRRLGRKESAYKKLAEYEDFEEIFRAKMTDTACELLSDKEEFGKWLDRIEWIAKKCDEYARAEEQGLLLKLPCKVGDRLYRIDFLGFIISDTVHSIHILRNTAYLEMNYWDKDISLSEVGKTAFLTQAEAEQKLKEMNTDNGITE